MLSVVCISLFVSEFPRLIHNSACGHLKYFVVRIFFVRWLSCNAVTHGVFFHPLIPNSSFILPIYSAFGNVWSICIPLGQEVFLFSIPLFRCYGAHPASCIRHRRALPGEWQEAYDFDYPTPSSAWLRMGTSVPPIILMTCTPYYRVMFNIYFDNDDDDSYNYDTA